VKSSYGPMPKYVTENVYSENCLELVDHSRTYSFRICDVLKKKKKNMHKNLQEQHKTSEQRISSLQDSLKKSENEVSSIKNEADKSNEHLSRVIKDFKEEI